MQTAIMFHAYYHYAIIKIIVLSSINVVDNDMLVVISFSIVTTEVDKLLALLENTDKMVSNLSVQ